MDRFQSLWIHTPEIDTGIATIIDLSPELTEVCATLVPYPSLWEEATAIACLVDSDGEINVLAIQRHLREACLRETTQGQIGFTTNAQVERTGIELVQLLFATTNATRRKERGHGIGDGFLYIGE